MSSSNNTIHTFDLKFGMKTLYEDKYCQVTDLCIVIKKYYFPLATSKVILYSDVAKISLEDALNVRHLWGPCTHCLNNWFHYDAERSNKQKFLSLKMKGQRIMPALTPEDPVKVFNILRSHFEQIDRRSVFSKTNKDSQTAMDHKEAEQQQKAMNEMKQEEAEMRQVTSDNLQMKQKREQVA